MRLAISLCNLRGNPHGLLAFDTVTHVAEPVDLGIEKVASATGLTFHGDNLLLAFESAGRSHIAFLNAHTLAVLAVRSLVEVRDIHSIAVRDDTLYAVSTGSDSVLRYAIHGTDLQFAGTFWLPTLGIGDSVHLNGISVTEGRFLCSGFGQRSDERWASARDGFVYDLDRQETAASHIYHPHSVTSYGGNLHCLESVTGHLLSPGRSLWSVDGYARGLCFVDANTAAIGSSVARRSSDAGFQNSADPGDPLGVSGITLIDVAKGSRTTVALGSFNDEVYDIVALPDA